MSFRGRQPLLDEDFQNMLREVLTPLWNEGYSAIEIAEKLKFGNSKYLWYNLSPYHVYYYRKLFKLEKRKNGIPNKSIRSRYIVKPKDVVPLTVDQVFERLNKLYPRDIPNKNINSDNMKWRAYILLVYYGLLRKSEIFERKLADFEIMDKYLKINLPRKKKIKEYENNKLLPGEIVPYYYPRVLRGIDSDVLEYLVERIKKTQDSDALAFPQITEFTSWYYPKKVLGTYSHYSRFASITDMAKDRSISLAQMMTVTGLDLVTIQNYIMSNEQDALSAIDKSTARFEGEKK